MNSSKAMVIVRHVYDWIESALWAGLTAFVIYFAIWIVPTLPGIARRTESIRALNDKAENSSFCEKWGMKRGTYQHTLCTMDLQQLREKIKQEYMDDGDIL